MKSPLRRRISPSVPFTLTFEDEQGKASFSYKLAYNWNSLALIEEQLGTSMIVDIGDIFENPTIKNVSVLLWAALQENHADEGYAGVEGLEYIRQNLTIPIAKDALRACSDAYVAQLSPEQQARLKKLANGEQVEQSDPLAQPAA